MQKFRRDIPVGARVAARGEPWLVVQSEPFDDCVLVTLRGAGDDNHARTACLLSPFDRITCTPPSARVRRASRTTVLRTAAVTVARAYGWLEPWSAVSARLDLLPWQFEPAMAAVAGATRLLLADAVGLGKTIQAGFILAELRARGFIARALLLTPAALRDQWAAELRERFRLDAQVFDHAKLISLASELPVGVNPWTTADVVISSIDLVKRTDVRAALDSVPIDLLVVDEAHHLTPGTDRGAVVTDLATRTPWVVLATATPHSGDEQAFAFLSGIGADAGGAAPAVFRRGPDDVGQRRERRVRFYRVQPTDEERGLLDETVAYAARLWRHRDCNAHHAFVGSVICRRAVSSSRALARTLARRRQLLVEMSPDPVHPELPWLEEEAADGVGADHVLGAAPLPDVAAEVGLLDRLISAAEGVAGASKFDAVVRLLRRTGEAAVVFSEYRDTLTALEERLAGHFTVTTLHGGLSTAARREAVRGFVDGKARVLLATDAAGEGLNLQARCRLVVNVELPWNPVRLEQRIGRIDRLGQSRRVHALHLYHRDSFEDRVLARLLARQNRASCALDDALFDEENVAAAIFDEAIVTTKRARQPVLGKPVAVNETSRLRRAAAHLAASARGSRREPAGTLCAALPTARSVAQGLALLFQWDVHDASGRLVTRDVACVHVRFTHQHRLRAAETCRWVSELDRCLAVRDAVEHLRAHRLTRLAADTRTTAVAVETRLMAIDAALRVSTVAPFQGSLFDRRAEQQATANRAQLERLRAHLAHQASFARGLRSLSSPHPPQLVAAWALPVE